MNIKITYYLDLTSSWCYWAEPAWAQLKQRYAKFPVDFDWAIALLDESGMSKSREQADWFYRRSGTIVQSPFVLNSGWLDPYQPEFLAINCVAEAAKDFGVKDDVVRLALMEAAMREGKKIAQWEVCAQIAAKAGALDPKTLLAKGQSKEIETRVRSSTSTFHSLQVTQRPTFVVDSDIGDRAVFSGIWRHVPLVATVDSMLADAKAYASYKAHFGGPPSA